MSNEEGNKPRSLRDIAARAKEARSGATSSDSAAELLGALSNRPSSLPPPPGSLPPGSLGARPSVPPEGQVSAPPSLRPSLPPPIEAPPNSTASPASVSVPPTTLRTGSSKTPTPLEAPASATPSESPPAAKEAPANENRSVTPILVGVGLIAVIGLGVVLTRKPEASATPLQGATVVSAEPSKTSMPEVKAAVSAPEVKAAPLASGPEPGVVDINALAAPDGSHRAAPRASGLAVHHGADHGKEGAVASAAPVVSAAPAPEPVASAAPRPMGSVGDLQEEMRKRVGATDQPVEQPVAGGGGNPAAKQEKPSNAAVLGALGAVRGAVKACIADTDKPTRISVVFQSDGSVRSVSVSGGATGGAEACVQAAVRKARVAPFMADSFSTSFSVSP